MLHPEGIIIFHRKKNTDENLPNYFKVIFTYFVPYCVTTWGAILGKLDQKKTEGKNH